MLSLPRKSVVRLTDSPDMALAFDRGRSTGKPLRRSKPPQEKCVRLTDRPDMTLAVYHGRETTIQQQLNASMPSNQMENKQFDCNVTGSQSM